MTSCSKRNKCLYCNIETAHKFYCSMQCRKEHLALISKNKRESNVCKECGAQTSRSTSNWCGKECARKSALKKRIDDSRTTNYNPKHAECKICGYRADNLVTHIIRIHDITMETYHHEFGDVAVFSDTLRAKLSENVSGDKNPWYNHGGSMSPWSKKYVKYQGLSTEELEEKLDVHRTMVKNTIGPNKKQYWLNKGYSEDEAILKVMAHQSTFSLEKCIQRHGEERGKVVWQERQTKWQNTLLMKSEEELERINAAKNTGTASKISQQLFTEIDLEGARWAHKNGELRIKLNTGKIVSPDFILKKKIIEFYGDKWHANPDFHREEDLIVLGSKVENALTAGDIWGSDKFRIDSMIELGYEVLIIWEHDFRKRKQEVLEKCKAFLRA